MSTERNVKVACDSLLLAAVLWAGSAAAQSSESFGLEQLMAQLAHVERAEAPLESSGTLIYEAPDRMIKRTDKPKPETMIVEGERLTLERQGRARTLRLQDYPVLWAFIESIRATLKGDLAALQRFYLVELGGEAQRWTLSMRPRDAKMIRVISSIEIAGVQGRIKTVKVQEAQGDRSVMTIVEGN
jgi:hypothetical protein